MSKRGSSHRYEPAGYGCIASGVYSKSNKERFASENAARRAMKRKRKWAGKDWPVPYFCDGCKGWHLGNPKG